MQIGSRLRTIRIERRMSQGDVEQRTGLLRCYVSRVENGHTVPSLETLERFAEALEVPLPIMFSTDGDGWHHSSKTAMDPKKEEEAPDLRKLEMVYGDLEPNNQELLLHIAKKMLKLQTAAAVK